MRPPRRTDALSPLSFSGSRRHEGQRIARRREEDALGDRIPRCVSCHLAARAAASRRGIFLPRISLKRPRRASPRLGRVGSTDARRATRDARDGRGAARGADAAPSTDATASRRISARAARSTRAAVPRARRASRVRPLPFARSTSEAGQLSPRATSTFRGVRRRSFFFDRSIDRSIRPVPSRPSSDAPAIPLPPARPPPPPSSHDRDDAGQGPLDLGVLHHGAAEPPLRRRAPGVEASGASDASRDG